LGDLIFRSGRKYDPEKLKERGYLFAVADGMGGHAAGEVASEMAVTVLFDRYYNGPSSGDTGTDLIEAVKNANLQVHQAGTTTGRGQMGTTLTLVLIKGNRAVIGNVGDSRTYLIRQGLVERVTHDHSLVQDQIDMGALTPEQAERSMIRNVITRAIGHRDEVEPDFFERELEPNDVILLCSDGLHGAVQENEIGIIVATSSNLKEAAQTLVNLANERGGLDNISVMIIGITEPGDPIPPILNGRAAYYPPPRPAMPTITEPITDRIKPLSSVLEADPEENTVTIDPSNLPTARNQLQTPTTPAPALAPDATTKQFSSAEVAKRTPKKRGRGLLAATLLILLLVISGVALYATGVLTGQTSVTPETATVVTGTTTAANATVSVPVVATVTPASTTAVGASGASSVSYTSGQIKRIQVILDKFPLAPDKYSVSMRPSANNNVSVAPIDLTFNNGNGRFEKDNVPANTYQIQISTKDTSTGSLQETTLPLTLGDTQASSPLPGVKLGLGPSDNSILVIQITNPNS
jgi:protein phosphatase